MPSVRAATAKAQTGPTRKIVADGLRAYSAATKEVARGLDNRAENSHQPFRRRERARPRFRSMKTLQKFGSVHAQVHNHFDPERRLVARQVYQRRRFAALAERRALAAQTSLEAGRVAPRTDDLPLL